MGPVLPEAIAAVERLADQGIGADLVCVTSPGLLYRALRARQGRHDGPSWILDQAFPATRARPLVTVLDGHPHTLTFLAAIHGTPVVSLGVDRFGQSGDLADTYRYHGLDVDSIVSAALDAADA